MKTITLPMSKETARSLRVGDVVRLTGVIYTARDAAHKRICQMLAEGKEAPIDLTDAVIYYAGPCPAPPGRVIGSCGPTTSGRMDAYAPTLYAKGVGAAIGKGPLAQEVKDAIAQNDCIYFLATGGAGALYANCVRSVSTVAFEDLGPEAIRRLEVEDFPVIVGVDTTGTDLYTCGEQ